MRYILLLFLACATGLAGDDERIPIGAASIDITPDYAVRLSGYGARRKPSEGVEQRLFAKALAIGSSERGDLALMLTIDNVGVPSTVTEKVFSEISAKVKLPREQFVICASHTHSAPMLAGVLSNLFGMDIIPEEWAAINRYTEETTAKLVKVGLEAIANARPAELFYTKGSVSFAKNRRTEGGPVDHELPMLAARADGRWTAILVNYACHCTTLGGEFNKTCGDWAGYAQQYIQESFPGATTLVAIGCGGDANPNPRGNLKMCSDHGREIANEVERLVKTDLVRLKSAPKGTFARFNLAFDTLPTRAQWEEKAKDQGAIGYHARKNLARLERGEKLPTELDYSAQVWAFGDDLAMVFLAGEVVVDYSIRIKQMFGGHRVWVNAYANDDPCYIPSKRILAEGGYEGGGAMVYYDRPTRLANDTEERIIAAVDRIMPATFKNPSDNEQKPKSGADALKTFRLPPGFQIELVASEPLVIDPVAIDFAPDGRLWVAEMRDYPMGIDGKYKPGGRIKVLSSTRGDGHFDHADTLVDDVPFPTGVTAWKKGALVCAAPNILYIEDTDGDGKADVRKVLYSGFATHNFQARVNSLRWGLDGWLYGAAGLFGGTIHSHITGKDHLLSGRDFRIKPDTGNFEVVAGLSQQGRVRDDFGNWFGCDNGMWIWHFPLPDEYLARNPNVPYPESRVAVARGANWNEVFPASVTLERFNDPGSANHTTSACGLEVFRDVSLGLNFYGNAFTCEPVHNLVHRLIVSRDGTTFAGYRGPDEEHSEFLASTDNWFRPVEIRTGPDGALWVVDMYRYVIEHPRWISSNRLAQLDVRAGDQQGRIYRVTKVSADPSAAISADFTKYKDAELVALIGHSNGTVRDLAHRLLLERNAKGHAKALKEIATSSKWRASRVQALYILDQLNLLDRDTIELAIQSPLAEVRATAVRLAESHFSKDRTLPAAITPLAGDSDPGVRLQLAFTLGEIASREAGEALARIATSDLADSRMRSAVLSSSTYHAPAILEAVLKLDPNAPGRREMIDGLIRTAAASSDSKMAESTLALVLPADGRAIEPLQLEAANTLLQSRDSISKTLSSRLDDVRQQARVIANDASREVSVRRAALELLSRAPIADADLQTFSRLLDSDSPELQRLALSALRKASQPSVAELLLSNWSQRSPAFRTEIIRDLLQRETWTTQLLNAVEHGTIGAREFGPTERQTLLRNSNQAIAMRAKKLLDTTNPDRAAVVAAYAKIDQFTGDPLRGAIYFAGTCSGCHLFRGQGSAVGPDLATYRNKPASDFVLAILDPSAAIEPRFVNYQVETKDGRSFNGVIANENASGITLLTGSWPPRETLLRSQIASIKASNISLMPEGFESGLDQQKLADVISYLRMGDPANFGSAAAGNATAARERFIQTAHTTIKSLHATETLNYPSPFGTAALYHCRQTDGKSRVDWQATSNESTDGFTRFQFPAAIGFASQPAGDFAVNINHKYAFTFDVTLHDAILFSDGKVRASYFVEERNAEDSSGILVIELDAKRFPPGTPVDFSVSARRADSQRWFGIYDLNAPSRQ